MPWHPHNEDRAHGRDGGQRTGLRTGPGARVLHSWGEAASADPPAVAAGWLEATLRALCSTPAGQWRPGAQLLRAIVSTTCSSLLRSRCRRACSSFSRAIRICGGRRGVSRPGQGAHSQRTGTQKLGEGHAVGLYVAGVPAHIQVPSLPLSAEGPSVENECPRHHSYSYPQNINPRQVSGHSQASSTWVPRPGLSTGAGPGHPGRRHAIPYSPSTPLSPLLAAPRKQEHRAPGLPPAPAGLVRSVAHVPFPAGASAPWHTASLPSPSAKPPPATAGLLHALHSTAPQKHPVAPLRSHVNPRTAGFSAQPPATQLPAAHPDPGDQPCFLTPCPCCLCLLVPWGSAHPFSAPDSPRAISSVSAEGLPVGC